MSASLETIEIKRFKRQYRYNERVRWVTYIFIPHFLFLRKRHAMSTYGMLTRAVLRSVTTLCACVVDSNNISQGCSIQQWKDARVTAVGFYK